jgi:hypothetical protein
MNFCNIITGEILENRPPFIRAEDGSASEDQSIKHYQQLGWRRVTEVAAPTAGYRVISHTAQEIGGATARLLVATEVNIADEQKAEARALLDSTDGLGRVLLTLAEQLVILINTERAQHGRSQITPAQIKATLQAALQ